MNKDELIKKLEFLIENIKNNKVTLFEYQTKIEPRFRYLTGFLEMDSVDEVTTLIFGINK